jgi:xylulokinase
MTLVAGVDSSTQSCKVVIRDAATGALVRSGRASHPDGTEVDPQHWWTALQSAIADAGGLDDVEALSVGGQQHGMVALDAAGQVIRPALLWNDTRSAQAAVDLIAELASSAAEDTPEAPDGAAAWAAAIGSVPVASLTVTKLRWLRDAEPENAARVAAVALPHDWLTWRLAGYGPDNPDLSALTTDRSDASGTGYWSPFTEDYRRDLLVQALGHDAVLPRVLGPSDVAHTVQRPGLAPLVLGPGAGDNAAAALGLGMQPGDVADRCVRDRAGDAGRADRDDNITGDRAQPQRGAGVVAGAGAEQRAGRHRQSGLGRPEHPRQHHFVAEPEREQVAAVLPGRR